MATEEKSEHALSPHKPYGRIVEACEGFLLQHGDNYLGVGWTKGPEYAELRYRVMLDLLGRHGNTPVSLLDFGCGAAHLYEYLRAANLTHIQYSGLDISPRFIALCREKFPSVAFYQRDLLEDASGLPEFDYVVMNGVFTLRAGLSTEAMWSYARELLRRAVPLARHGLAFNVMSPYVDWERDDLFHAPIDAVASFVAAEFGRTFTIRHDYGLHEYTVYVFRQALSAADARRGNE